jgi:antitoxin VapB
VALNIKNREVERLAAEVARLTNSTKTDAIRQALLEKKERLSAFGSGEGRGDQVRWYLELQVWPTIPKKARRPWTRQGKDAALGYGKFGEPV